MASASGTGGTGGGTGGEKGGGKDKAPQKRDFRKGKPYKTYTLAEKEKIVEMIEDGYRTCEIVRVLRVPESSVRNIRRAKTDVKKNIASIKKYTCNLKNEKRQEVKPRAVRERSERNHMLLITEHYLVQWLSRRLKEKCSVDGVQIRNTALSYAEICRKKGLKDPPPFTASKGWLQKFKKRCQVKHSSYQGEIASADDVAAKAFVPVAKEIVTEGNYSPEQIFNCDETAIYWRRTPKSTYIPKEMKQAPGLKLAKDKFSVLLTCNATGDCKMKPLVIYKFAKPHSFRNCDMKNLGNCYWFHNSTGYMTAALSIQWFDNHFVPDARAYCKLKKIPFKVVLFLDNAPGHAKFLVGRHPSVEVVFLPPNTTSKLQPLDQELISNVKLVFYRYLHDKMRTVTDSRKELEIIRERVSGAEEEDEADPATPLSPSPRPATPASPSPTPAGPPTVPELHLPNVPPGVVLSVKEFWKKFQIKQAVDLLCRAWREITAKTVKHAWHPLLPHLQLQEQDIQTRETLLQATTSAIQSVPGLRNVDQAAVEEMVQTGTFKEPSLAEMMEVDQDDKEEKAAPQKKDVSTHELSKILGKCAVMKEEVADMFSNKECLEQAMLHLEKFTALFRDMYQEKLSQTHQAKITQFFRETLEKEQRQQREAETIAEMMLADDEVEISPAEVNPPSPQPEATLPPPQSASPQPGPSRQPQPEISLSDLNFIGFDAVDKQVGNWLAVRGEEYDADDPCGVGSN